MSKDYARAFYKSAAWQRVQHAYMVKKCYVCERCGAAAKIVHHKTYITPQNIGDPRITLSMHNLEALCQSCHNQEHGGGMFAPGFFLDDAGNFRRNE